MNAMTWSLVAMYGLAAVILVICVLKDMHRSILRAGVSLGLAILAIPLAILLTHNNIDSITSRVLHMINLDIMGDLTAAIPSLEEGVVGLVHMVAASEIYRLVLLVLIAVLGLVSYFVCRAIEKRKPALSKRSKPIGAAIGVVFGLVMIVAIMAPTAGYAAEAPEVVHILGEYEQITHAGEEALSEGAVEMQSEAQKTSDTVLLKMVRALGGKAIFKATTTVEIGGVKTDLYTEFHALDALGADVAVLSAVPVEQYGDREYDTLKSIGNVFEQSVLLRVLGAEGLSTASRAWLKNETFLGIAKPSLGDGMDIALDAAMIIMKDTTKDTIAKDVRALTPAVSAALRAFNTMQSVTQGSTSGTDSDQSSTGGSSSSGVLSGMTTEKIDQLVTAITESAATPEAKEALLKAGIGLVAKEMEQYFVGGSSGSTTTQPSEGEGTSESTGDGETPEQPGETPVTPEIPEDLPGYYVPEADKITQEEYDAFVEHLTTLALSGALRGDYESVLAQVKTIRDQVGIAIDDASCAELVKNVVEGPYAALFQ